jgi:hypothetical protein
VKVASWVIVILLFSSVLAFAQKKPGGGGGNGGGVWTCRDSQTGKRVWSKMLDFHEAEKEYKLHIPFPPEMPIEKILEKVGERMKNADPTFYAKYLEHELFVLTNWSPTDDSKVLRIDDTGKDLAIDDEGKRTQPLAEETCPCGYVQWEQLGNFTHDGFLMRFRPLWEDQALSNVQKAMFWVHEAMGRFLRKAEVPFDALRTRKIVAFLFSDKPEASFKDMLKLKKKTSSASAP